MADDRPDPDLYERDFYAWTRVQAAALRAPGAAGSNIIEWARVAEEIEDLGSERRHAIASHLQQIIVHLHKLETSAALPPRAGWRDEIRNHRREIEERITPSIRNEVIGDLDRLHRKAARHAQKSLDDYERDRIVDTRRRWTLPQLLGEAEDPLDALDV